MANTADSRATSACATSCSAVPAWSSKDAANFGVITSRTKGAVVRHGARTRRAGPGRRCPSAASRRPGTAHRRACGSRTARLRAARDVGALDEDRAPVGLEQPDEGLEEHRLAGPGRAEHHADLAGGDGQGHVAPDQLPAERLRQPVDLDLDTHDPPPSRPRRRAHGQRATLWPPCHRVPGPSAQALTGTNGRGTAGLRPSCLRMRGRVEPGRSALVGHVEGGVEDLEPAAGLVVGDGQRRDDVDAVVVHEGDQPALPCRRPRSRSSPGWSRRTAPAARGSRGR